jgi:hypothetical protein
MKEKGPFTLGRFSWIVNLLSFLVSVQRLTPVLG